MGSREPEGQRSTEGAARSPGLFTGSLVTGLWFLPPEGQVDVGVWPGSEEAAPPSDPPFPLALEVDQCLMSSIFQIN